jgi:hypothetical protein
MRIHTHLTGVLARCTFVATGTSDYAYLGGSVAAGERDVALAPTLSAAFTYN